MRSSGGKVDAEAIVGVATRLFAVKGFRGTTMRDVSAELGVHAGSLYVHIRDKDELLERIVMHISGLHEQDMADVLAMDASAEAMLREVCRRQVGLMSRNREAYRVYFHEWRHLAPERQAQIVAVRDAYERALQRILRKGVAEGVLDHRMDLDVAGKALLGMVNWTYQWFSADGPLDADEVADTFVSIFLRGGGPQG